MDLAGLVGRVEEFQRIGRQAAFRCPVHQEQCAGARESSGGLELWCDRGCTEAELSGLLGIRGSGAGPVGNDQKETEPVPASGGVAGGAKKPEANPDAAVVQGRENAAADPEPTAHARGGNAGSTPAGSYQATEAGADEASASHPSPADQPAPDVPPFSGKPQWQIETERKAAIFEWEKTIAGNAATIKKLEPAISADDLSTELTTAAHDAGEQGMAPPMWLGLTPSEIDGSIARVLAVLFNGNGKAATVKQIVSIPWESYALAVQANDAYLAREPVIHKLCYSSAVSMITGGKHAGKSTLARWMAICVAKGYQFLKREVIQGPVFYIASEDEAMPARQELIRLGWNIDDPLRFFSSANMPTDDPLKFLQALASDIKAHHVSLVVLDMLFDFVRIADEMSYAGTREAVGHIQDVASQTGAHLTVIHHAPKNAAIGDAAVAALGSQGLAARVSPIILVRRFGPGVHSIVSTSVRDPRGEAIMESRLLRHEDGSVTLGGVWKTYMLAEAYSERVLEFLNAEDGAEVTASDLADGLSIAYEVARACLASLWKGGLIDRTGQGKKGKPFRYTVKPENTPHSVNRVAENESATAEEQGRFGYKD